MYRDICRPRSPPHYSPLPLVQMPTTPLATHTPSYTQLYLPLDIKLPRRIQLPTRKRLKSPRAQIKMIRVAARARISYSGCYGLAAAIVLLSTASVLDGDGLAAVSLVRVLV